MLASPYRGISPWPQRPTTRKTLRLWAQHRELNFGSRMCYIRFNSDHMIYDSLDVLTGAGIEIGSPIQALRRAFN